MKNTQVNALMILGAVLLVGIVGFVLYRLTLAPAGPTPKAADAPSYTKPGYSGPAPYGAQSRNQSSGGGPPGYARQGNGGGMGGSAPR